MATVKGTDWREQLRASGYRLTPQRELVLEAVEQLDHATPEAILERVQRTVSGVNISTVYRTLDLLSELGLVAHTHLGHGAPVYHAASEPEHVHLVCRSCGGVTEAPPSLADTFLTELGDAYGFAADVPHLTVFGTCRECREAAVPEHG
jgi:Fur family transcriptional regulator, ferric uptake regulator